MTGLLDLQERARKGPEKRIRGARYNPNHTPERTIGEDLDAPVEFEATPDNRLF